MATYLDESVEEQRKKREGQAVIKYPWIEAAKKEWNEKAFAGNPEGRQLYEQGRSAIGGVLGDEWRRLKESPPGRAISSAASEIATTYPRGAREIANTYQTGLGSLAGMHGEAYQTDSEIERRRAQAGLPVKEAQAAPPPREAAPNMPTTSATERLMIPQPGLESEARRTYAQPRAAETTGQKTASQISNATSFSGRPPAASSDARQRYLDMAKMSLEQREKFLESLPVGQRPIQVIRGNQESWYSPGMSREFATIPEAMTGVQGRPTYQSEEDRAQAEASRSAIAGRQAQRIAAEERMQQRDIEAGKYERVGRSGTAHGSGGEKWKVEKVVLPDGTEAIHQYDEGTGKHITIRPGDANQVSGVLSGYNYEDSKTRQMALDMLTGLGDQAAIDNTFRNQPDHVQKAIMQAIKERKEQEKKK